MKLIIFCVESDKKAQTDTKYIDKAIRSFYVIDNNVRIAYVYMNGKGNYAKNKVTSQIKRLFSGDFDEKHVVYCIDIDNCADSEALELNERIRDYCKNLNYDFVWFCRDIEEVFLHKRLKDSEKVGYSNKFMRERGLGKAAVKTLSSKTQTPRHSNLLCVLDGFMDKKSV